MSLDRRLARVEPSLSPPRDGYCVHQPHCLWFHPAGAAVWEESRPWVSWTPTLHDLPPCECGQPRAELHCASQLRWPSTEDCGGAEVLRRDPATTRHLVGVWMTGGGRVGEPVARVVSG
jgi:hypothetical protein